MKMKKINTCICLIFAIFLLAPCLSFGQNSEEVDSVSIKIMKAARSIMTSTKTCALITLDDEGLPRVRAMEPFPPDSDFTVWFGTNAKSRKVAQIKKDPRITLYYLDGDGSGYVMIYGLGEIVNNEEEKEKRWKEHWEALFSNKDEEFVLLKVSPQWMEVLSFPHGIKGDPVTWEVPRIMFNSK
jgi:general stress protein 26